MYRVVQDGRIIDVFPTFSQAWIHCILELRVFAIIRHPIDGTWVVNPAIAN